MHMQVRSEEAQVLLHVIDWNYVMTNETLGELSFPLRRWNLPESGAPITLVLPLHDVTGGAPRNKKRAQGELRLQIGWCRTSPSAAAAADVGPISPELVDLSAAAAAELGVLDTGDMAGAALDASGALTSVEQAEAATEAAEAALREDERKEGELAAIRRPPPSGAYQLQVHVIEGRDLVGRDSNGVSDAMVVVSAFGSERRTATKYKQSSPLWDEQLFLSSGQPHPHPDQSPITRSPDDRSA